MKKRRGAQSTITLKGSAANTFFAQLAVAHNGDRALEGVSPGSPMDVAIRKELERRKPSEKISIPSVQSEVNMTSSTQTLNTQSNAIDGYALGPGPTKAKQ